eukprot:CAMPEP_0174868588 /NCGR_PEP_ID=MMETSP1114-20130205/66237_1 /TAXON_ID=312471 /ORGANISM="Neobodo designis, Strain CCAP 1951/1" /LENGTH=361 /DNA_ID=CAMNT_0016103807 /DNA_START=121 /DNA_END=1203 /DNA_ORIENTATION=-
MPYVCNPDAEPFTPSASSTPAMEPRRARLSRLGAGMPFAPGPIIASPGGGWLQLEPPVAVEVGVGCGAASHSAKGPASLPDPTRFKTTMCDTVERGEACPYGARCTFAHGDDELRTVEQNIAEGITTQPALVRFQKAQAKRLKKARRNRRQRELAAERAAAAGEGNLATEETAPGLVERNESFVAPAPGRRVPVPLLRATALPVATAADAEAPTTPAPGGGIGSAAPSGRRSATYRHDPYTSPTTQREATASPLVAGVPTTATPPPPGTPLALGGHSAGVGVAFGASLPADLLGGVGGTPLCGASASAPGGGSLPHPAALFPSVTGHGSEPPTPLAEDREAAGGSAAPDRYTPVGPGGALV